MRAMPSVLSILLLAAAPVPTRAQGVFDMGGLTQSLTIPTEQPRAQPRAEPRGEGGQRTAALPSPPGGPNRDAFDFRPDPAVTLRMRAEFLERFEVPETRAVMARNMENMEDAIAQELRASGLEATNLSDAQAFLLVTAWQALHREERERPARLRAVSEQMAEVNTNKALTKLDDATKQEMAETLLYDAHYVREMSRIGQDSPAVRAHVEAVAQEAARAVLGFDVREYRLTDKGFEP